MKYIADLHIHSPYSRATSKNSNLQGLHAWARIKGINVVGTGDFTHPGWFRQLKENLIEAEPGFFKLKEEKTPTDLETIGPEPIQVRFVLSTEISSIYKRHDKVRKVHNVLFAPDFASVERLNAKLAGIGNIESDGRPILGLDSRDLLEILLEQAPEGFLVPAHIWTPWFSLFGSKSGFDTMEDCFGDLTEHIFALETGLSSDPDMNRMVSALDRFALISNSDCHSPGKLGREANIFDTSYDYYAMRDALKNHTAGGFQGTIEFFPEEGKYHLDGHRKCRVCLEPRETRLLGELCPVCQRPLTVGVAHRVLELADRQQPYYEPGTPPYKSIIPLPEVLGEILGLGPNTKGVMIQYAKIISLFGSEFNLFLKTPIEDINQQFSSVLGEAIQRIRTGKVIKKGGYDGEFGIIRVFEEGELASLSGQISLFSGKKAARGKKKKVADNNPLPLLKEKKEARLTAKTLNFEQEMAVNSNERLIVVAAGPGTGKTHTLVNRMGKLLLAQKTSPGKITAITFTNRAADEVKERLIKEAGQQAEGIFVGTFHRFCLEWLRKDHPDLEIVGDESRVLIIKKLFPDWNRTRISEFVGQLHDYFHQLSTGSETYKNSPETIQQYLEELYHLQALDLDAVIPCFVKRLEEEPDFRTKVLDSVSYLFVDEFQDLNRAQYELVYMFSEKSHVFAIGDPDQAIYGFRGSDLNFFFQLAQQEGTTLLTLSRNYRCARHIIEAASSVINHNPKKGAVKLVPHREEKGRIEQYRAATTKAEAEFVVRRIEELMGGISHFSIDSGRGGAFGKTGISFRDIAVLYRLTRQVDDLREALERRGIPFQLVGAKPFFKEPTLRAVYYWIVVAANRGGAAEHLALLKEIKGIGQIAIKRLEKISFTCKDFFAAALETNLPAEAKNRLRVTQAALKIFWAACDRNGLRPALEEAMDFLSMDKDNKEALRFLELATAFGHDIQAFAHHLEQNSAATVYDDRAESVALMTLHGAKGLEFPVVFITGTEEGLIPYDFPGRICDIEEERRLFYVGVTRAADALILSSTATRTMFGKTTIQEPSRFIKEIPQHLISIIKPTGRKRKKPKSAQMKLF